MKAKSKSTLKPIISLAPIRSMPLPASVDESLGVLLSLGIQLSKTEAEEIRYLIEDALEPEFIEDAEIANLLDHVKDLGERAEMKALPWEFQKRDPEALSYRRMFARLAQKINAIIEAEEAR